MKAIMFVYVATLLLLLKATQGQSKHIKGRDGVKCYAGISSSKQPAEGLTMTTATCYKEGCVSFFVKSAPGMSFILFNSFVPSNENCEQSNDFFFIAQQ